MIRNHTALRAPAGRALTHACSRARLGTLDFSLKPPSWLRAAVTNVVNDVKQVVQKDVNRTTEAVRNATTPSHNDVSDVADTVDKHVQANVPGGWVTVGAIGLLGAFLLLGRKGRK